MKYGKEFQSILNDPAIPEEWRNSAIEYGRLKKLIKDVVAELSGMGLSPHVLHKLLATETDVEAGKSGATGTAGTVTAIETPSDKDEEEILEFEFESPENSPPSTHTNTFGAQKHREAEEVIVKPIIEDEGSMDNGQGQGQGHRTFRLRLLSETNVEKPKLRPMGVMDMVKSRTEPKKKVQEDESRRGRKVVRRAVVDDHGAVKAEYVLVGDSDHPTPQLRLHVSATTSPDRGTSSGAVSSNTSNTTDSEHEPTTSDSEDELDEPITSLPTPTRKTVLSPLTTPRAFNYSSPRMIPQMDVAPPSPSLQRLRQAVSPIWALATGSNISDGLRDLSLDEGSSSIASIDPVLDSPSTPKASKRKTFDYPLHPAGQSEGLSIKTNHSPPSTAPLSSSPSERDFIIPLASDVAFFNLLTTALTSLSAFHAAQQETFRSSVEELCTSIRASVQPSSNPHLISSTPLNANATPNSSMINSSGRASKKDLYAWREIFTLWIEHEIFESTAERTRGERTVEQAQERLQAFANEVVKRGLGDRRTIKGKKARGAWEEFLRLNVLLLDLKRFQLANINAARKILKKHDKRTALTASAGFPSFVRSTLTNSVDKDGNVSTWNFYNTSLPHVLLASLTDTLLPILPSLDDYACLICTSIAFKPIRLACGHLFCVRCLVKMQRANKAECPLCRSKVVLRANKESLDMALMRFMKDWFPKEVKEKQRENEREIAHEHAGTVYQPSGRDDDRCVTM